MSHQGVYSNDLLFYFRISSCIMISSLFFFVLLACQFSSSIFSGNVKRPFSRVLSYCATTRLTSKCLWKPEPIHNNVVSIKRKYIIRWWLRKLRIRTRGWKFKKWIYSSSFNNQNLFYLQPLKPLSKSRTAVAFSLPAIQIIFVLFLSFFPFFFLFLLVVDVVVIVGFYFVWPECYGKSVHFSYPYGKP